MKLTIHEDVLARFRGLRVAWALVEGLEVQPRGALGVEAFREAAEQEARASRDAESLKDDPVFRAYRDFFWQLGVDPTKTRPSGEALNRRVLNGGRIPAINGFVDAYNAASLATRISIGAYDADALEGDLALRFATKGEEFRPIGSGLLSLEGGEVVLSDDAKIVNFYPYRDSELTKITLDTTRAVLVACGVPGVRENALRAAVRQASHNVRSVNGGSEVAGGSAPTPA